MANPISGIYRIRNTLNGKRYIGSSRRIRDRWKQHKQRLKQGTHSSRHLQAAWDKYGKAAFVFEIVILCQPHDLIRQEQIFLDARPEYNTSFVAQAAHTGIAHSDETKAKLSALSAGRSVSPAVRQKISDALKGVPKTPEHNAKVSASHLGKKHSPEHVESQRRASTGKKASDETRAKLSAMRKGRIHDSPAQIAQHAASYRGFDGIDPETGLVVVTYVSGQAARAAHLSPHCMKAVSDGRKRHYKKLWWSQHGP